MNEFLTSLAILYGAASQQMYGKDGLQQLQWIAAEQLQRPEVQKCANKVDGDSRKNRPSATHFKQSCKGDEENASFSSENS